MKNITRVLIEEFERRKASDLHLAAGYPAMYRTQGRLEAYANPLTDDAILTFLEDLVGRDVILKLNEREEVDLSAHIDLGGNTYRFRVNIALFGRKHYTVLRRLEEIEKTPQELHIPSAFVDLVEHHSSGVIFVTGATGSGKSTTLASVIAQLLRQRPLRVVTLEDPIEYIIPPGKGMITQREVVWDTKSFAAGLRAAMRQDPDVILVGEVRDAETAEALLAAAETGHLVFTTMHVASTTLIPERIMGFFSSQAAKEAALTRLAGVFAGALTQTLVPAVLGQRLLAWELLEGSLRVRNMFRSGQASLLRKDLKDKRTRLADCLIRYYVDGLVTEQTARSFLNVPDEWDARYVQELKDIKRYTTSVSGLDLDVFKKDKKDAERTNETIDLWEEEFF